MQKTCFCRRPLLLKSPAGSQSRVRFIYSYLRVCITRCIPQIDNDIVEESRKEQINSMKEKERSALCLLVRRHQAENSKDLAHLFPVVFGRT